MIRLILIAGFLFCRVYAVNVLNNPGFESGLTGWTTIGTASFSSDSIVYIAGKKSAAMTITNPAGQGFKQAFVPVAGCRFIASAKIKTSDVSVPTPPPYGRYGANLLITFSLPYNRDSSISIGIVTDLNGNGWTELKSDTLVVSSWATSLVITLRMSSPGTVWFDDIRLENLGYGAPPAGKDTLSLNVDTSKASCRNLIGFGAEWDPCYRTNSTINDTDFQKIIQSRVYEVGRSFLWL
jgi:hypothetical protein